jgi:hypothetical protein
VQRALEHERSGDAAAALADLDRALEIDPKAATALITRANLFAGSAPSFERGTATLRLQLSALPFVGSPCPSSPT